MSINVRAADEREVGDYSRAVSQVRNNNGLLSDEQMVAFMKISTKTLNIIRFVITKHPDWDDDDVAEKVLDLQDEGFEVEMAETMELA